MWTRAQLKGKAKAALKVNYWKMVLVSLIITIFIGGAGSAGGANASVDTETSDTNYEDDFNYGDDFGYEEGADEMFGLTYEELKDILGDDMDISEEQYEAIIDSLAANSSTILMYFGIFLGVLIIIVLIALVISLLLTAYLINPLQVGCSRFFTKTLENPAQVKEVAFAFDNSYKNVVKVMFFRTLYTMLWSLLFVIPGLIKAYEYRMIPYLMADNPNLTKEQAFALSKQMMMGQKWSAFILDLSFIGWELLSVCTVGILEIFYVGPYMQATNAALYEELSSVYGHPAQNTYVAEPYQPVGAYEAPVQEEYEQTTYNEE